VPFFAANEKSATDKLRMNTMQTPELDEAMFYNDLPETLEKAWLLLEDAARNRHSPMHTPVLVSSGEDLTARARTVVLRDTVRTTRELRIHADSRSAKIEELHRQPTCQVLAYHPVQKIQLRLDATATIHQENDVAREIWAQMPLSSRRCYLAQEAPGSRASKPTSGLPTDLENRVPEAAESEAGFRYFAAVAIKVEQLEWLYLAAQGHRRAQFDWAADGVVTSCWLVP
jgi:hypothetical protein